MQSGVLLKLIETASGTNRFRDVVAREGEKKKEEEEKENEERNGSKCK